MIIFLIVAMNSHFLEETPQSLLNRIEYNQKFEKETTDGSISYVYDEKVGTHCKVNKNLFTYEPTISVNDKHLLTSYDMFPFKLEFIEIANNFFEQKYGKLSSIRNQLFEEEIKFVFAIYLILYDSSKLDDVYQLAKEMRKNFYSEEKRTQEQYDYLKSLPTEIYSAEMFNEEEMTLVNELGYGISINLREHVKEFHGYLIKDLEKKKIGKVLIPILKDLNNFKYFYSIIGTRAFSISLVHYERIKNKDFKSTVKGDILYDYYKSAEQYFNGGFTLIPFIDLCNLSNKKNKDGNLRIFNLIFEANKVTLMIDDTFQPGDEYAYAYSKEVGNIHLFQNYGFYIKKNPDSEAKIIVQAHKSILTQEKYDTVKAFGLITQDFSSIYKSTQDVMKYYFTINKKELNKNALKFHRIYLSDPELEKRFLYYSSIRNQWITYENEFVSLILLYKSINSLLNESKISYYNILQSLFITKSYYKENKEKIDKDKQLLFKYNLRKNIMEVGREQKEILMRNKVFIYKDLKSLVSDQMRKLKSFYLNSAHN